MALKTVSENKLNSNIVLTSHRWYNWTAETDVWLQQRKCLYLHVDVVTLITTWTFKVLLHNNLSWFFQNIPSCAVSSGSIHKFLTHLSSCIHIRETSSSHHVTTSKYSCRFAERYAVDHDGHLFDVHICKVALTSKSPNRVVIWRSIAAAHQTPMTHDVIISSLRRRQYTLAQWMYGWIIAVHNTCIHVNSCVYVEQTSSIDRTTLKVALSYVLALSALQGMHEVSASPWPLTNYVPTLFQSCL